MSLYDNMLNISNKDIETIINNSIKKINKISSDKEGICKVVSNMIYHTLLKEHVVCKIINTKELGLGYEHEFVLAKEINNVYLIDATYEQFINKGTILNKELLNNGYIKVDNTILINYLNSIPNTYKIENIEISELFLSSSKRK